MSDPRSATAKTRRGRPLRGGRHDAGDEHASARRHVERGRVASGVAQRVVLAAGVEERHAVLGGDPSEQRSLGPVVAAHERIDLLDQDQAQRRPFHGLERRRMRVENDERGVLVFAERDRVLGHRGRLARQVADRTVRQRFGGARGEDDADARGVRVDLDVDRTRDRELRDAEVVQRGDHVVPACGQRPVQTVAEGFVVGPDADRQDARLLQDRSPEFDLGGDGTERERAGFVERAASSERAVHDAEVHLAREHRVEDGRVVVLAGRSHERGVLAHVRLDAAVAQGDRGDAGLVGADREGRQARVVERLDDQIAVGPRHEHVRGLEVGHRAEHARDPFADADGDVADPGVQRVADADVVEVRPREGGRGTELVGEDLGDRVVETGAVAVRHRPGAEGRAEGELEPVGVDRREQRQEQGEREAGDGPAPARTARDVQGMHVPTVPLRPPRSRVPGCGQGDRNGRGPGSSKLPGPRGRSGSRPSPRIALSQGVPKVRAARKRRPPRRRSAG